MRQARWNLTGFLICINGSQRILTLFNFYFYFPNAITSFQSHQDAQSFFRVLICFKKLVQGRRSLFSTGGGLRTSAGGASLYRDLGTSSPRKFWNLEARKWHFQHSPWDIPLKKSTWIKCKMTILSVLTAIFWRSCELDTYSSAFHDIYRP